MEITLEESVPGDTVIMTVSLGHRVKVFIGRFKTKSKPLNLEIYIILHC